MRQIARRHEHILASVVAALSILVPSVTAAQVGPIRHYGYLEYQQRLDQGSDIPTFSSQIGTWRAYASTWLWRPYILQLNGDIALTRSRSATSNAEQKGAGITGGLSGHAFGRSRFPLRFFAEKRDSRTDGGRFDRDVARTAWGLNQQFSASRWGTYGVDYQRSDTSELYVDGIRDERDSVLKQWVFTGLQSTQRNQFDFSGKNRKLFREQLMQTDDRLTLQLRHRFRQSARLYVENTTFYSDETIGIENHQQERKLFQFNGLANWLPRTERPLRVTGRMILRARDMGAGSFDPTTSTGVLSGAVVYTATQQLTLSANSTATKTMNDNGLDSSSVAQRVRATYRGEDKDLGRFRYYWSGSGGVGNTRQRNGTGGSIQDGNATFAHGLTRTVPLSAGRQFGFTVSQNLRAFADSVDRKEWSAGHAMSASLSLQHNRTSNYLRFMVSDRRTTGSISNSFQLASLQASSRTQMSRKRSWNGSLTLQYSSNSSDMADGMSMASSSVSYSVSLSYREQDLFNRANLDFESELRLLSSEFRNDDPFDQATEILDERDSNAWRNSLSYRVGQLHMSLNADLSAVNDRMRSRFYFLIRRYYGST